MDKIHSLMRKVFDFNLRKDKGNCEIERRKILLEIESFSEFYFIGQVLGDTIAENALNTDALISCEGRLVLFLLKKDAEKIAIQTGKINEKGDPLILALSLDNAKKIIDGYKDRNLIHGVDIFICKPIIFLYAFQNNENELAVSDTNKSKNPSETTIVSESEQLKLVEDIKRVLDLPTRKERRALDSKLKYENLHQTIDALIRENRIDIDELNKQFDFPDGFLRDYCKGVKSSTISKQAAQKMLGYFGLELYLYEYKNCCTELIREFNRDKIIDFYEIKPARGNSLNPFVLSDMKRKIDKTNNAYVYELVFCVDDKAQKVMVSSPKDYVLGNKYEIIDPDKPKLNIPENKVKKRDSFVEPRSGIRVTTVKLSDEKMRKINEDRIIQFLKMKEGCNTTEARKK